MIFSIHHLFSEINKKKQWLCSLQTLNSLYYFALYSCACGKLLLYTKESALKRLHRLCFVSTCRAGMKMCLKYVVAAKSWMHRFRLWLSGTIITHIRVRGVRSLLIQAIFKQSCLKHVERGNSRAARRRNWLINVCRYRLWRWASLCKYFIRAAARRLPTSPASWKILYKYYINEHLLCLCGTRWLISLPCMKA